MRRWIGRVVIAAGMVLAATENGAADKNDDNCYSSDKTDDQTIAGCTTVLGRSKKGSRAEQASAYYNRGLAYNNKEDDERALADFDAAIRLDASDAKYYRNRGRILYRKKVYDRAVADFGEAIRLDPDYGFAYDDRADFYADVKGDYDQAIKDYGEFIRIDPSRADTYYKRGLAFEKKADFARALADLEQAASRDAEDADIRAALTRVRAKGPVAEAGTAGPATIADLEAQELKTAAVWARLPFSARHAMFVSRKAEVFGGYEARPSNVFAPGEPLLSYLEPTGYAWKTLADGTHQFGVTVDWELVAKGGKVLGGQKALLKQEFTSHFKNREFFLSTTMSFDGLDAGDYVLAYTLHDYGSPRTARVELPFTIKP